MGEMTTARFQVYHLDRPTMLFFKNGSPSIVRFPEGNQQNKMTTGGADNHLDFKSRTSTSPGERVARNRWNGNCPGSACPGRQSLKPLLADVQTIIGESTSASTWRRRSLASRVIACNRTQSFRSILTTLPRRLKQAGLDGVP